MSSAAAASVSGKVNQQGSTSTASPHSRKQDQDDDAQKARNIDAILYAGYDIKTWYHSPFPEEYNDAKRLFVCEYCLKYIMHLDNYAHHTKECRPKKPPGVVVYTKGINKIYKVDGRVNKLYCQNLSLLGKLFLDNKTLYYDLHGFEFYVLTESRSGDRVDVPVGFFSKEIVSYDGYNLACILILPPFQRKGYGKLLIEFSYELTKFEGKVGSPEKPLSDLGRRGYISFWTTAILRELYPKPWPASPVLPYYYHLMQREKKKKAQEEREAAAAAAAAAASAGATGTETVTGADSSSSTMDIVTETLEASTGKKRKAVDLTKESESSSKATASTLSSHNTQSTSVDTGSDLQDEAFSIRELATRTGVLEEDILETLVEMGWTTHWQTAEDQASTPLVVDAKVRLTQDMEQAALIHALQFQHSSSAAAHLLDSVLLDTYSSSFGSTPASPQRHGSTHDSHPNSGGGKTGHDGTHRHNNNHNHNHSHANDKAALQPTDVLVVSRKMVKDYQEQHRVRLDRYMEPDNIDWTTYRNSLGAGWS